MPDPRNHASRDKAERFCTEPGCTYPAAVKCAAFSCPQRNVRPLGTVAGSARGQSVAEPNGGVLLHAEPIPTGGERNHV